MRGQLFSSDATIALFVFLLLIAGIFYITSPSGGGQRELLTQTGKISDFLVYQKFGTENNMECAKLLDFSSKTYSEQKKDLGRDFFLQFENKTKVCAGGKINSGFDFTNKTNVASIVRIISLEENVMRMQVKVYE